MLNNQKRDAQIIKMRNESASYKNISKVFDLSVERTRQIFIQFEIAKKHEEIRKKIFTHIKSSNNINQKWAMRDLIYSLQLSNRATTLLIKFFEDRKKSEISLKNLMDSLTPNPFREDMSRFALIPLF